MLLTKAIALSMVRLNVTKGDHFEKNVLETLGSSQLVGEQVFSNEPRYTVNAFAKSECDLLVLRHDKHKEDITVDYLDGILDSHDERMSFFLKRWKRLKDIVDKMFMRKK